MRIRISWMRVLSRSAGTAGIYQFSANPCFNITTNVWVMGFEVVFPTANLTDGDDSFVFTLFMTKDSRSWSLTAETVTTSDKEIVVFLTNETRTTSAVGRRTSRTSWPRTAVWISQPVLNVSGATRSTRLLSLLLMRCWRPATLTAHCSSLTWSATDSTVTCRR